MYHNWTQRRPKIMFSNKFNLNNQKDFGKIYTFSPPLLQDLYEEIIEYSINFIPVRIFQDILDKKDLDLIIGEIIDHNNFEKVETKLETNE